MRACFGPHWTAWAIGGDLMADANWNGAIGEEQNQRARYVLYPFDMNGH
jgi:hypothetical protein